MTIKGSWPDSHLRTSTCPDCGKRTYLSRKDARRAMKRWGDTAGYNVYRCGDGWHFGHKPTALRRGLTTRERLRVRNEGQR